MSNPIFSERLEWFGSNGANKSGKSNKFYLVEIFPDGNKFNEVRRWGRFGAKGRTKTLVHWSEMAALDSAQEQLAKKRKKGYTSPVAPLKRLAAALED